MFREIPFAMAVSSMLLAASAGGGSTPAAPTQADTLATSDPVHHLDVDAREPMLVEHPDGALFVTGYGRDIPTTEQPPRLWKSNDRGATWERVDVGSVADGAKGNSDVDLTVGADGTLYFITMGFDRSVSEGTHVAVGVSRDVGETWSWSDLTRERRVDRPWGRETPGGVLHVIWNDGNGVAHAVSPDSGQSWEERPRIHPRGGSSHLAVGPNGELAVRITPISASGQQFDEDVELIAVSTDEGVNWAKHVPPGDRVWTPNPANPMAVNRWVEPVAWDDDGALYYLWSENDALRLARSTDLGATWRTWTIVRDEQVMFFPYLVARGSGELAATWFSGADDALLVNVALIEAGSGRDLPRVTKAEPFQQDAWVLSGGARRRDPAGEYVPVAFLADGSLGVVTPIQNGSEGRGGFTFRKFRRP